jgi:hypothetical protein
MKTFKHDQGIYRVRIVCFPFISVYLSTSTFDSTIHVLRKHGLPAFTVSRYF